MALKRMDNVLIVVEDLEAVKAFFIGLGLELEGEATVEGPMVGKLIGLENVRATLAMLRPPGGQGGIELDKFHTPDPIRFGPVDAPVNALGLRRVMFGVEGIDGLVARMRALGAEIIGEMDYGNSYRLAYIRGPEGIIVGLAEEIPKAAPQAKTEKKSGKSGPPAKPAPRTGPARRKKSAARAAGPRKPLARKSVVSEGGAARKKRKA